MTLKLDENQQKAVEHFQGSALVIAGPGSGKTTVIKERILHLIRKHDVDPYRILALAFNKEAAKEMEKRILSELRQKSMLPEIRTLHAFGRRIINKYYNRLERKNKPEVWASDPERTIREEIQQLKRNLANVIVTIYKIESELTGKCYIGQTTNPKRRRGEHFSFDDSSNPDLRQAMLNEGEEHFKFYCLDKVEGKFANRREAKYIEYYRKRAVVNLLEPEVEQLETDVAENYISVYKIESKKTGICYILQSTDSERSKVEDFIDSSNDVIRKAIEVDSIEQFTLEVLHKKVLRAVVPAFIESAIQNASSRSRAVFNQNNPLRQRYSDQLMIELFCEHFNICYEELLKRPSRVENLMQKIEDFEKIVDKVERAKRETNINFTGISSIDEVVQSIIESINDPVVRAFAEKYENKKKKANAIDFQDMILYAVYLLEVYPDICDSYREKYDYVHIDEFQDVSPIDFRLTKPLSANFFVVGDDDQAIYGFRGGNSEIMLNFHKQENVQKYKITRNYRSTSTIVEHSKNLIENNTLRISKKLHAENLMRPPIKVLETTEETVESTFLREFAEPVCQTQFIENRVPIFKGTLLEVRVETQKIGIPVRYRSEVDKIRQTFRSTGFTEIDGEKPRKKGESFKIIGRGKAEIIEVSTIHKMKGKEYDKVILIHNTLGEDFPFHNSDDITEDRRVFYVAMTRAKRELVILGGDCQFVTETGLSVIIHKRRKRLEKKSGALNTATMHQIDLAKKMVGELSEMMQTAIISILMKHVEVTIKETQEQCEDELSHLQIKVEKTQKAAADTAKQLETQFSTDLKAANAALLEELIPVLDTFESQIKNLPVVVESHTESDGFTAFTKNVQLAQTQLLNLLKDHELKPIDTPSSAIFNPVYHEEVSPAIYSDEVQAGWIAREERRGYLLRNQVIRKAQVVVSKGPKLLLPETLDWIVERYLDRLISEFKSVYNLKNINRAFVKEKIVQYLTKQDNESVRKIHAFAVLNKRLSGQPKRFADYCVGPEKTDKCTPIFQDFWNRMWEVVEQSRKTPESFKSEPAQPSIDKPTPMLKIEIERSEESITIRNVKRMSKTTEPIPEANISPLFPKAKRMLLNKSISVIVPEFVEEEIDTPPPISADITENLNMYIEDPKTEIPKTIEVRRAPLYEPTDLIIPEPVKGVIDSRLPTPKNSSEIPNSQIQNLKPETPRIEIVPDLLETVNSNADSILQGYEEFLKEQVQNLKPDILEPDIVSHPPIAINNNTQETLQGHKAILKKQRQEIKPETSEPENSDNVTQVPTLETGVDHETPVKSTTLTRSDSSTKIDNDAPQVKEQNSSKNEIENTRKSLGYYLRRGRHFAVEKIKATFFKKPNS